MLFLSTPSARRATYDVRNPLKLRQISIHTLREEGDALYDEVGRFQSDFYPRPPRGGRLYSADGGFGVGRISIHALREEGDPVFWYRPRSVLEFLSTPSARRATSPLCAISTSKRFLSTPSARRATVLAAKNPRCSVYFYPRPPRGGRPAYQVANPNVGVFLSTPSARRATPTATST